RVSADARSAGNRELAQESARQHQAPHHIPVPFFPDDKDQCGPATLASVLTFWGVPTDPQDLRKEVYTPRLGGALPMDLLLAAQARGLDTAIYSGGLDDLKSELAAGHPLVALLNLGSALFPQGHYVVVTGYDDRRQGVYVHSGPLRDDFVPYERFLRSWEKTGRLTLLVLPDENRRRAAS
ncbi:MAG: C39 family peptidase, partial [Nitrospirota bacterium]|nr:C39 family peptidase [Nitrospirota bacterium]